MFQNNRKFHILMATVFVISFVLCAGYSYGQVHTVISRKPLAVGDGETGIWYTPVKGTATMSWTDRTRAGFFSAKALVINEGVKILYRFDLVAISSCHKDCIEGLWDIRKNGILVCNGCVGNAYGMSNSIGQYFKLYIGDSQCNDQKWHLGAFITDKIDF